MADDDITETCHLCGAKVLFPFWTIDMRGGVRQVYHSSCWHSIRDKEPEPISEEDCF